MIFLYTKLNTINAKLIHITRPAALELATKTLITNIVIVFYVSLLLYVVRDRCEIHGWKSSYGS